MTTDKPAPAGQTTLSQVADLAGVSISTVSRVVSKKGKVSEEKKQAVEKAIEQLAFTPNALAQGLKRGRSMTIGVVTPMMVGNSFSDTLYGIDKELSEHNYAALIVVSHFDKSEEMDSIRLLLSRRVDGIIILSSSTPLENVATFARQVPILTFGQVPNEPNALGMTIDNERGGYLATRHLIEQGHHHIAHITGPIQRNSAIRRLAGYRQALEEAGIGFDPRLVVEGDYIEQSGVAAVAQLFERGALFSAIFAANDQSASGALLALHRRGIRVPDDVSLVGFDDTRAGRYLVPPLTTVHVPLFEMGQIAARGILDLVENRTPSIALPPLKLIIRESTARA